MTKRSVSAVILQLAGKILSNLPMVFMACLLILGVVGLVMLFLLSGTNWKIFGVLINRDMVSIIYGMLFGIAAIVAGMGFAGKKKWAWKTLMGICVAYLAVTFLSVLYRYAQGALSVGYLQNSVLHVFYGFAGLFFLNHKKVRKWINDAKAGDKRPA